MLSTSHPIIAKYESNIAHDHFATKQKDSSWGKMRTGLFLDQRWLGLLGNRNS
jgi:hypothetical protein